MKPSSPKQEIEIVAGELPDNQVEIAAQEYDSLYEQVVRPDRAVYLPGYFRRWLPVLGPDLAWMYIAYRQLAYGAARGRTSGSISNRFSGKAVAALCGSTERTYWNRIGNTATLEKMQGLIHIANAGPEWDEKSPTPKRLPRRFTVAMTLPLTPADSASLRKWISEYIETCGGPEKVLRAVVETPLEELLSNEVEGGRPVTARALVHELFSDQLDAKILDGLASAIQNHIMVPGDLIVVTQYFLENILPHLGAGPAWMLTILRDMCFTDANTGESRNRVTVKGGYAEIAGWLGMSRPKTIWEWLNEKHSESHQEAGKYQNSVLQAYVQEVVKDEPELDFAGQARTFDVLLEEVPQELIQMALTGEGQDTETRWREFQYRNGAIFSIGVARFSESNGANFSIAMARFSDSVGATFTVKALNSLKPSLNSSTPNPSTEPAAGIAENGEPEPEKTAAADSVWDLEKLLQINSVHPKTQKALGEAKVTARAFVAHLLFAFSKQNSRIQTPLSFALDQMRANPNPPDAKFAALAAMPAETLIAFLTGEASREDPLAETWRRLMGNNNPRLLELLPLLLGDAAPTPEELNERKRSAPRKKTDLQIYLASTRPAEKTWTCPHCGEEWPIDRAACVACGELRPVDEDNL
jgi:hypothetical protein